MLSEIFSVIKSQHFHSWNIPMHIIKCSKHTCKSCNTTDNGISWHSVFVFDLHPIIIIFDAYRFEKYCCIISELFQNIFATFGVGGSEYRPATGVRYLKPPNHKQIWCRFRPGSVLFLRANYISPMFRPQIEKI